MQLCCGQCSWLSINMMNIMDVTVKEININSSKKLPQDNCGSFFYENNYNNYNYENPFKSSI